jgi:steroid delta-isomerase-like uncharacterized protein
MDAITTLARNTAVVRRLMEEVWGRGQLHLIAELVAVDYVGHFAIGDHYGPEGVRIDVAAHRTAFPDMTVTVDDLFAHGDKVVRRYTLRGTHRRPLLGVPANGVPVVLRAIAIDRLEQGRLLESWVQSDQPGTLSEPSDRAIRRWLRASPARR